METMTLTTEQHNIISHIFKIKDENSIKCVALLEFFIKNYPEAPGSSGNHQNYFGGFFIHISDVMDYAIFLYRNLSKKEKLPFTLSDALLVLFLHDIEKPVKYSGKSIESDGDIRSTLIKQFGIQLTEEHVNALKYIHGEGEDYRKDKRIMSPLCAFCHCCDVISARIFYN